jgi:hypothetical protein
MIVKWLALLAARLDAGDPGLAAIGFMVGSVTVGWSQASINDEPIASAAIIGRSEGRGMKTSESPLSDLDIISSH